MKFFNLMTTKSINAILISVITITILSCNSPNSDKKQPWSVRMADSEMKRNPEPWMIDLRETPKWEYTQGLVLNAILQVGEKQQNPKYFDYVTKYYDRFIDDAGNIMTYDLEEYNIDRINPGKPLFRLYRETSDEKFKKAIFLLRKQMLTHPRTSKGGYWHKNIYPHQMWLDGIYMASPFLAEFARTFDEPALFDDVAHQIILMEKHARDEATGLLYHGWDESRMQRWANPVTGQSPHFWGRAIGWYAMALVDVLDFMPTDHPQRPEIIAILQRLAPSILKYQDIETGLWYQIIDMGEKEGNYPESSASCMITYALFKAVRNHYIDGTFLDCARKAYNGILEHFIEVDENNIVQIHNACSVAGLGGDPYRDGSFEYYISEKVRSNDAKAVGPFILASLEKELIEK